MKKVFSNPNQLQCIFTDEGITFYGTQQEVYLPYGCIDSIKMSFMGVLQATSYKKICTFAVNRKDRAEMKDMIQYALKAMKTAPKAEAQLINISAEEKELVPADLPPEEKLKRYKALFVQGKISKEDYDARKRQLKAD